MQHDDLTQCIYQLAVRHVAAAAGWVIRHTPSVAARPRNQRSAIARDLTHEVGQHTLMRTSAGFLECKRCRLRSATTSSLRSLRAKPCAGTLAAQCHPSHRLRVNNAITWCTRCGAYTTRRPRRLRERCPGQPRSEAQRNVIRRLRLGLQPTTAEYLIQLRSAVASEPATRYPAIEDVLMGGRRQRQRNRAGESAAPDGDGGDTELGQVTPTIATRTRGSSQSTGGNAIRRGGNEAASYPPADIDNECSVVHDAPLGRRSGGPPEESHDDHGQTQRAGDMPTVATGAGEPSDEAPARPPALPNVSSVQIAKLCHLEAETPWSRRIRVAPTSGKSKCHICMETRTASWCSGCLRLLCRSCARSRAPCLATLESPVV